MEDNIFKFSLKAESADFDLKLSWMNLDTILWFDLCATHAMWNTTSFAQVSWFSAETADFRYQVWHKNPPAVLDRVSMVVVLGPKSQFSWLSSGKTLSLTLHCLRHPTPSWHTFLDSSYQDLSYEIGPTTSRAFHYFDLIQYSSWLTNNNEEDIERQKALQQAQVEELEKNEEQIRKLEMSIATLDMELERFDLEEMRNRTQKVVKRMSIVMKSKSENLKCQ